MWNSETIFSRNVSKNFCNPLMSKETLFYLKCMKLLSVHIEARLHHPFTK